jgi:L-asparaginase/beta-aspartyl-peptidase (threonine type)
MDSGAAALDMVEWAVAEMESSGLYVAGRGSAPNLDGVVEFDASIMDGAAMKAGAVCAIRDVESPIAAARAVLDRSPHVLLAGEGATRFAREMALPSIPDPASFYRMPVGVEQADIDAEAKALAHGTVGAVALDSRGRLAAATSTGGTFGKRRGPVGDTPIPGLGTWADDRVAVSCTGVGEYFILAGGAGEVAACMRLGGADVEAAAAAMIARVGALGGDGGVIALDARGHHAFAFNSAGMKRAICRQDRAAEVAIC